jgi:hypothetical protein
MVVNEREVEHESGEKFCSSCKRYVTGKKKLFTLTFCLLLIFVWLPVSIYGFIAVGLVSAFGRNAPILAGLWLLWLIIPILHILNYVFFKKSRCPICNKKLR